MKRNFGFTMVELMIVVAILGIIVSIAYPSYEQQIIRSKRADGISAMMNLAQAMERYRVSNYNYGIADISDVFVDHVPVDGGTPYYTLSAEATDGNAGYLLTATPVGSMDGKDDALTLTHTGAKTWGAKTCWPTSGNDC